MVFRGRSATKIYLQLSNLVSNKGAITSFMLDVIFSD